VCIGAASNCCTGSAAATCAAAFNAFILYGSLSSRHSLVTQHTPPLQVGEKAFASQLLLNGEALDPPCPLTLILHKPAGYVVTSPDDEVVLDPKVYDLLPYR
jgi:16S rRNA U516 pseudouridylate synthase RsuA-like enzyme